MTSVSEYIFVIVIAAVGGMAALTWIHMYGMHKSRQVRRKQRADDRAAFCRSYRNTAQALLCTQPLVCYYNDRVNKKQVRAAPLYEALPKQCWIAQDDGSMLAMDTRLAIQWALDFAALRAALIANDLRTLDEAMWPSCCSSTTEPEETKRRHSCGTVIVRIGEYLYRLKHPRAVYQHSRKVL